MRIIPYLRSTMTEDRLHGLALMYAHKDSKVYVEECMDLFQLNNIQTWSLDYHEKENASNLIILILCFKKDDNYYYRFIVRFPIKLDFLFLHNIPSPFFPDSDVFSVDLYFCHICFHIL